MVWALKDPQELTGLIGGCRGNRVCAKVWCSGNYSQIDTAEAKLCVSMCVPAHTHQCMVVSVSVRMRLQLRLEKHTKDGL